MAALAQITIGDKHTQNTMEYTVAPTQVTIGAAHTHNSMYTDTKTNCEEKNGG